MLKLCTLLKGTPFQPTKCLVRTIFVTAHQKTKVEPPKSDKQSEDYEPIFQFPYMRTLTLLNRLKVYQTILTGITIPATLTLNNFNVIDFDTFLIACSVGISICLPLYGFSVFCRDIVGYIYVNKDATKTKIAYLDFWGKRVDIVVNTKDIIPFSEQPQSFTDGLYVNLSRYSTKDKLKVNFKYGRILDDKKFTQLFSKPALY